MALTTPPHHYRVFCYLRVGLFGSLDGVAYQTFNDRCYWFNAVLRFVDDANPACHHASVRAVRYPACTTATTPHAPVGSVSTPFVWRRVTTVAQCPGWWFPPGTPPLAGFIGFRTQQGRPGLPAPHTLRHTRATTVPALPKKKKSACLPGVTATVTRAVGSSILRFWLTPQTPLHRYGTHTRACYRARACTPRPAWRALAVPPALLRFQLRRTTMPGRFRPEQPHIPYCMLYAGLGWLLIYSIEPTFQRHHSWFTSTRHLRWFLWTTPV